MTTHDVPEGRSPAGHSGLHRFFPAVGIAVVVIALLAHFAGGAALLHLGLGSNVGGGALVVGLAAVVSLKVLAALATRRWWRQR
jgi:hypothetical protein